MPNVTPRPDRAGPSKFPLFNIFYFHPSPQRRSRPCDRGGLAGRGSKPAPKRQIEKPRGTDALLLHELTLNQASSSLRESEAERTRRRDTVKD